MQTKDSFVTIFLKTIIIVLLLFLFVIKNSFFIFFIYLFFMLTSIKFDYVPLIVLGASNYIPSFLGLSPLVYSIIMMLIYVIFRGIHNRYVYIGHLKKYKFAILVFCIWCFITSFYNNDYSFFNNFFMIVLFSIIFILYCFNTDKEAVYYLKYIIYGMSIGIILGLLIQMGVSGFSSNHPFRLAIGERADPNSTGLLFAIMTLFFTINFIKNFKNGLCQIFFYGIPLVLSILCEIFTQSRASMLVIFMCLCIYGLYSFDFKIKINKNSIVLFFIIILVLFTLFSFDSSIEQMFSAALRNFQNRITSAETGDGDRSYLLKQSLISFMHHPIFGTTLKSFEIKAGHIPHNTFSDFMVTNGLFGIIYFIYFLFYPLFKFRKIMLTNDKELYYCYLVCIANMLSYSASNEKIIYVLLILLYYIVERKRGILYEK